MSNRSDRRRGSRTWWQRLPAVGVFYTLLVVGTITAGVVHLLGLEFIAFSVATSVGILIVLWAGERKGFARLERRMRNTKVHGNFTLAEVAVLIVLFVVNVLVSVLALVR